MLAVYPKATQSAVAISRQGAGANANGHFVMRSAGAGDGSEGGWDGRVWREEIIGVAHQRGRTPRKVWVQGLGFRV
jgi:hypothetical protein